MYRRAGALSVFSPNSLALLARGPLPDHYYPFDAQDKSRLKSKGFPCLGKIGKPVYTGCVYSVETNLKKLRLDISRITERLGRSNDSVQLLAVSKTFPPGPIRQAAGAGQRSFGENRIQEAEGKISQFVDLEWHLIGPIQSNKALRAVQIFDVIQTLDRAKIINRLGRFCNQEAKALKVYLQINIGEEPQKYGSSLEQAASLTDLIDSYPRLELQGLMCLPPFNPDPEGGRIYYSRMRELLDELNRGRSQPLSKLSMGMSHDYQVAIEEGSTMVRVGTSIFGRRKP